MFTHRPFMYVCPRQDAAEIKKEIALKHFERGLGYKITDITNDGMIQLPDGIQVSIFQTNMLAFTVETIEETVDDELEDTELRLVDIKDIDRYLTKVDKVQSLGVDIEVVRVSKEGAVFFHGEKVNLEESGKVAVYLKMTID